MIVCKQRGAGLEDLVATHNWDNLVIMVKLNKMGNCLCIH